MYKQILLVKQAEALLQGFTEPVARLIEPGHVKRAQADSDTPMQEELREYIRTLKPQKDSTYVLVNAMGDGEHYGDNINGDFFPYEELVHTDEEFRKLAVHDWTGRRDKAAKLGWGFTTFYHAHVFKHHINKDPAKAYGTIDWAGWNTKMRRVELVTRLDHAWCKERGGEDILEKAHRNDFQDVSMGCKVPYDVCSICSHKAKTTPLEYCAHIRERRTNRDPRGDGTRPYMINIRPRFFDLSYVFIGADKTARSLMKIAMAGLEAETQIYDYIYDDVRRQHPKMQQQEAHKLAHALYEAGYSPYAYAPFPTYEANDAGLYLQSHRHDTSPHTPPHQKTASSAASHFLGHGLHMAHHHHLDDKLKQRLGELKQRLHRHQEGAGDAIREKASALKLSDLIKYRVPHPNAEEVSRLEKGQRMIPGRVIDQSVKERGLEGTLHDSAREGIVLRKPEFARAVLRSSGLGRLMPIICSRPLPRSDDFSLPVGLLGGQSMGAVLGRGPSIFSPFARVRSVKPDCVMLRITIIQPMKDHHHHHHDDFDDDDCYGEEFGKYASVRDPSSEKVAEMISAAYNGYRAWLLAHAEDFGLLDVGVEKGASSEYGRYRSRGGSYGGLSAEEKGRLAFTDLALSWSHWR